MNEQAEFAPAVMEAEAELIVPEAPVMDSIDTDVSESASHAAAVMSLEPTPQIEESQLQVETVLEPAPIEVAPIEVESTDQDVSRQESRVEELKDDRYQALEDEREKATEEALREYETQREEELELAEAAGR